MLRCLGIVVLVVSSLAAAQGPHAYVQIYNFPEADSCATWTQQRTEKNSQALQGWVLGLISGRNAFGSGNGDIGAGVKAAGLTGWIDQYCAANPLDSVTTAGFKLVKELESRSRR